MSLRKDSIPETLLVDFLNFCSLIVSQQDIIVGVSFVAHHGSTYLTETHSVSPSGSDQFEALRNLVLVQIKRSASSS